MPVGAAQAWNQDFTCQYCFYFCSGLVLLLLRVSSSTAQGDLADQRLTNTVVGCDSEKFLTRRTPKLDLRDLLVG